MKKLLCLAMLGLALNANAQSPVDSNKVLLQEVCLHLDKSHKQFQAGTGFFIAGTLLTGITAALLSQATGEPYKDPVTGQQMYKEVNREPYTIGFIATGLLTGIGCIIMIDSHRHIGNAGKVMK